MTAKTILEKVPQIIDMKIVMTKYPVKYEQSMNTVLAQEVIRLFFFFFIVPVVFF